MMLQIQYWISKNTKLFMAIVGLLLATMVYALYATYSDSTDTRMEHESKVLQEIEEVNKEKEAEITQDVLIPEKVKALPTREDIQAFFDANKEEFKESQVDEYAMKRVAEEFGDEVRLLVEEGYLVSANLTPEDKLIMQLQQGELLYWNGGLSQEDLEEYTAGGTELFKVSSLPEYVSKYKILNYMSGSPKYFDYKWVLYDNALDKAPTYEYNNHVNYVAVDVSGEVEYSEVVRATDLGNGLVVSGGIVMKDLDLEGDGDYYNDVWLAIGVSEDLTYTEAYDKLMGIQLKDLKGAPLKLLTQADDPRLPAHFSRDDDTQKVTPSRYILWRSIVKSSSELDGLTINDKKIEISPLLTSQIKSTGVEIGLY